MRSLAPHLPRILVDLLGDLDRHNQSADHVSLRGLPCASRHVEPCRPIVVISIGDRFRARAKLPRGFLRLQNICRCLCKHSHLMFGPQPSRRLVANENMTPQSRQRFAQNLIFSPPIAQGHEARG